MARKGRPRKSGQRTKSDRLSRAGAVPTYDRGTEWVQAMKARYGEYYNTALGRAFAAGLLGEGNEAKDRYDKARKFASLYRRVIGDDRYRCPLDQSPRGSTEYEPTQQDVDDQEWLLVNITRIEHTACRPFLDQLTGKQYTDHGPSWLDAILNAKRADRRDTMVLDAAIRAIDAIGPVNGARVRNVIGRAA